MGVGGGGAGCGSDLQVAAIAAAGHELAQTPDEAERMRLCEEVAGLQKLLQAAESAREREIQEKAEERERMEALAEEALREYHQARNLAPQIERGGGKRRETRH